MFVRTKRLCPSFYQDFNCRIEFIILLNCFVHLKYKTQSWEDRFCVFVFDVFIDVVLLDIFIYLFYSLHLALSRAILKFYKDFLRPMAIILWVRVQTQDKVEGQEGKKTAPEGKCKIEPWTIGMAIFFEKCPAAAHNDPLFFFKQSCLLCNSGQATWQDISSVKRTTRSENVGKGYLYPAVIQ